MSTTNNLQPASQDGLATAPTVPRIAALIPAFNEEPVIEGTIAALVAARCPKHDIYVVDDRSTDRTAELARRLGVRVFTVPCNGGKARAQAAALRYFGLTERYDWILFLDGDTKVEVHFMDQMRAAASHAANDVALYVGQVRSVRNTHLFSALRAMEYAFSHDLIKQGQSNCNVILVSPGCASMYRTSVLKDLHIDHGTLAEDMDLTIQAHRAGKKVAYVPSAMVYTQDPATLKDYYRQVLRWDRGFWQIVRKHGFFHPLRRKQWIDLYVIFITVDTLLFNKVAAAALLLATAPDALPFAFLADVMVGLAVALYGACRTRRPEVFFKFPLYYWISYVNLFAFVSAMLDIVVLGKTRLGWNKVARYHFDAYSRTTTTKESAS